MNSFPVSVMGGNLIWLMIYAIMHLGGDNNLSIKLRYGVTWMAFAFGGRFCEQNFSIRHFL